MNIFSGKYSARLFWITLPLAKFLLLFSWDVAFYASFLVYLITGGWRYARAVLFTIPRDVLYVYIFMIVYCLILGIVSLYFSNTYHVYEYFFTYISAFHIFMFLFTYVFF